MFIFSEKPWFQSTKLEAKMYELVGPRHSEVDSHNRCMGKRVWCVTDICGIICAVMTWLLITYAEIVMVLVMCGTATHPTYTCLNLIMFNVFAFLAVVSHARAMFTDPVSLILYTQHGNTLTIKF